MPHAYFNQATDIHPHMLERHELWVLCSWIFCLTPKKTNQHYLRDNLNKWIYVGLNFLIKTNKEIISINKEMRYHDY